MLLLLHNGKLVEVDRATHSVQWGAHGAQTVARLLDESLSSRIPRLAITGMASGGEGWWLWPLVSWCALVLGSCLLAAAVMARLAHPLWCLVRRSDTGSLTLQARLL